MSVAKEVSAIQEAVLKLKESSNSDIILFNALIYEPSAAELHSRLNSIKQRKDFLFLILVTFGGDAHTAYIIGRELQRLYKKVTICIAGDCYSAGTLVVLSANEIVIADSGKLGPLDIQLLKKDELKERISGLAVEMSLRQLSKLEADAVRDIVSHLKEAFGRQLSFKTALEVASNIVSHAFGEIYRQIDPIRIGEDARALQIASHYGNILGQKSGNLKEGAVDRLLEGYPSHECVIDRGEAAELFTNVRQPNDVENELLARLSQLVSSESTESIIINFTDERFLKEAGDDGTADVHPAAEEKCEGAEHNDSAIPSGSDGKPEKTG